MEPTPIKNYSGIKASVQQELDMLKQHDLFHFNDEDTVMMLSQSTYDAVVAMKGQNPCFCLNVYVSPWRSSGVVSVIIGDRAIEKTAVVSYGDEMFQAVHTPKKDQLELLKSQWELWTTRNMMRLVIQSLIDKADPSHDTETLHLLLENVDMLPADGQSFTQPQIGSRPPTDLVLYWFIHRPEQEDTSKFANTELIEVARIADWSATRHQIMYATCLAVFSMTDKVNKAQTLLAS